MRLVQAVRVGAWFLVGLNLLMAIGAITILGRMTPAIAVIIERNERSLQACQDMLAVLAVNGGGAFTSEQQLRFRTAYTRAKTNITEAQEPAALERIESALPALFRGDVEARQHSVASIIDLATINRNAMVAADQRAQQLGHTGAWGVAFMAMTAFFSGVVFIRSLTRRVVKPLEEIHTVIIAHRNGETMRRCTGTDLAQDVRAVFTGINEFLDQYQGQEFSGWALSSTPQKNDPQKNGPA